MIEIAFDMLNHPLRMIVINSGGNTKRSGLTSRRSEVARMGPPMSEPRRWPTDSPRALLEMTYRPLDRWGVMTLDEVDYPETPHL